MTLTGPPLRGVLNRSPYNGDVNKVLLWIKNTPSLANRDPYYKSLKEKFNGMVMPPVAMPDEDLKAIIEYLNLQPSNQEQIAYMPAK